MWFKRSLRSALSFLFPLPLFPLLFLLFFCVVCASRNPLNLVLFVPQSSPDLGVDQCRLAQAVPGLGFLLCFVVLLALLCCYHCYHLTNSQSLSLCKYIYFVCVVVSTFRFAFFEPESHSLSRSTSLTLYSFSYKTITEIQTKVVENHEETRRPVLTPNVISSYVNIKVLFWKPPTTTTQNML